MKKNSVYDAEAKNLEEIAKDNNVTVAEVVMELCEYLDEVKDNNSWI